MYEERYVSAGIHELYIYATHYGSKYYQKFIIYIIQIEGEGGVHQKIRLLRNQIKKI